MPVRSENRVRIEGFSKYRRLAAAAVIVACCAGALAVVVISVTPSRAASVPSWLDDGISKWNTDNPGMQIRFVDIRDSFVWYDIPKSAELPHQKVREGVNRIVLANGYTPMDDEEQVTTGKPPASKQKKCWSRSFVKNIDAQSDTKAVGDESPGQRQRMLTSLVCEDSSIWWAAFRVAG